MLKVIRNHRRAAYGETSGYEGLTILPQIINQELVDDEVFNGRGDIAHQGSPVGFRGGLTASIGAV